jgi:tetratricopeptide (TPR) repeat protein
MLYLSLLFASALAFQTAPSQNAANTTPGPPAAPRPPLSLQDRGDIQMARKMYRDAIDTYKQAPESAVIMNKIGIAYHQLGELKSAEKYYKRAIKMDQMYTEAMNNLGTIYYSKKSYRRAIGQYKKVLRIKPNSASTLANLGSAYFARKQYELASDAYQQALTLDPHVFDSQNGAGSVVRDRTVGDRPKFFYYLAKSYAKAGMKDEAISYIRKALEEGFKERNRFVEEPEFAGLKNDPEFQKLMTTEPKVL